MNRRSFLLRSGAAAAAVAGLPIASRAARSPQQSAAYTYKSKDDSGGAGVLYGLTLYHAGVTAFNSANETEKTIMMGVKSFEGAARTSPKTSGEYKLTLEKVTSNGGSDGVYLIDTKVEQVSGDYKMPKAVKKNMSLRVKPFSYVSLLAKKDELIAQLDYVAPPSSGSSSDADCFLTTACVHHIGLADDCRELDTLRHLRDNYMIQHHEGRQLIDAYDIEGPAIVAAINDCSNSREIYRYMYEHMILPSVALVEGGREEEAVAHYTTFVKALQQRYC